MIEFLLYILLGYILGSAAGGWPLDGLSEWWRRRKREPSEVEKLAAKVQAYERPDYRVAEGIWYEPPRQNPAVALPGWEYDAIGIAYERGDWLIIVHERSTYSLCRKSEMHWGEEWRCDSLEKAAEVATKVDAGEAVNEAVP